LQEFRSAESEVVGGHKAAVSVRKEFEEELIAYRPTLAAYSATPELLSPEFRF